MLSSGCCAMRTPKSAFTIGDWSLEGIEAQGYDVARYALVYTGASPLLPPAPRLETLSPQPIFRLSYRFLRGLSRTSVE